MDWGTRHVEQNKKGLSLEELKAVFLSINQLIIRLIRDIDNAVDVNGNINIAVRASFFELYAIIKEAELVMKDDQWTIFAADHLQGLLENLNIFFVEKKDSFSLMNEKNTIIQIIGLTQAIIAKLSSKRIAILREQRQENPAPKMREVKVAQSWLLARALSWIWRWWWETQPQDDNTDSGQNAENKKLMLYAKAKDLVDIRVIDLLIEQEVVSINRFLQPDRGGVSLFERVRFETMALFLQHLPMQKSSVIKYLTDNAAILYWLSFPINEVLLFTQRAWLKESNFIILAKLMYGMKDLDTEGRQRALSNFDYVFSKLAAINFPEESKIRLLDDQHFCQTIYEGKRETLEFLFWEGKTRKEELSKREQASRTATRIRAKAVNATKVAGDLMWASKDWIIKLSNLAPAQISGLNVDIETMRWFVAMIEETGIEISGFSDLLLKDSELWSLLSQIAVDFLPFFLILGLLEANFTRINVNAEKNQDNSSSERLILSRENTATLLLAPFDINNNSVLSFLSQYREFFKKWLAHGFTSTSNELLCVTLVWERHWSFTKPYEFIPPNKKDLISIYVYQKPAQK